MYYLEQHKFFNDRLTIFKKGVSKNYYGRCWIDGKAKEKSSKTPYLKKAKTILYAWYRDQEYKLNNDLPVHDLQFNKLFKEYIAFRKKNKKSAYTKNIDIIFNASFKKYFHNRKINSISKKIIMGYIQTRVDDYKKKNKKEIAYATIVQDLMMISGFMNWCFDANHREKKISISKKWINEVIGTKANKDTTRTYFTIAEYDKLLKISRQRINASEKSDTRLRREILHQFIIFMVHSGLRTGEAYTLKWKDVSFIDKKITNNSKKHCVLNVSGKTGDRTVYTYFGAYFALKKIQELTTQVATGVANSSIFKQKFRRGLNDLLEAANLKTHQFGQRVLHRDSKSFRSTYISWGVIRGDNVRAIADNCGTSPKIIQDFYTKYIEIKNFKTQLTEISNVKRLHMNGA